jgi:hypothetical protein
MSLPVKIGIAAFLVAEVLVVAGILKGTVPANVESVAIAVLISGLTWGVLAWAVAQAVVDTEASLDDREADDEE